MSKSRLFIRLRDKRRAFFSPKFEASKGDVRCKLITQKGTSHVRLQNHDSGKTSSRFISQNKNLQGANFDTPDRSQKTRRAETRSRRRSETCRLGLILVRAQASGGLYTQSYDDTDTNGPEK